ncbi:MbtH family protein [Tatumella citrea]|uniref:MbtH-like domain-containing protein n=1 Tax=Tatumella citrea TaxID=53336 RepID=A0A1Y0LER2_TATCI|nr:MbtH family NRPS accessory protein [Tatumella citrea]ARU92537.1 hypothetical protein A7K98_01200 [Tatumella citrea]ARU96571.1 hypothetical protein A7K99_01195 [Tatumella citrea]
MNTLHLFDQPEASASVLKNHAGQFSLWPESVAVPAGWQPVYGPCSQEQCLLWLETHWTDIRPTEHLSTGSRYV